MTKKLIFDGGPRFSEFGKKKYLIANRKLMVIPNIPSLYFSIHNTSNVLVVFLDNSIAEKITFLKKDCIFTFSFTRFKTFAFQAKSFYDFTAHSLGSFETQKPQR